MARNGEEIGKKIVSGYIAQFEKLNSTDVDAEELQRQIDIYNEACEDLYKATSKQRKIAGAYIDAFDLMQNLYSITRENFLKFELAQNTAINEISNKYNAELLTSMEGVNVFDRADFTADFFPLSLITADKEVANAAKKHILVALTTLRNEWFYLCVYEEFLRLLCITFCYQGFEFFSLKKYQELARADFEGRYQLIYSKYFKLLLDSKDKETIAFLKKYYADPMPNFDAIAGSGAPTARAKDAIAIFENDLTKVADRDKIIIALRK